MVSDDRDLTRVASVLIAIGLRLLRDDTSEESDYEPDGGLYPSIN
jgi:hypothetical protein